MGFLAALIVSNRAYGEHAHNGVVAFRAMFLGHRLVKL